MSELDKCLSCLPQDLLRSLQGAASSFDLYIDGLSVDEVVERYTALGCQITRDLAALIQQETATARAECADVSVARMNERQLAASVASGQQPERPHNYALPAALAGYATADGNCMMPNPQDIKVHGFHVTDVTHTDHTYRTGAMVWLGHGNEGRWLSAIEVLDVARALRLVALAQMRRVALEGGGA